MGRVIDLTGQRFGKLTVLSFAGMKHRGALWLCICDCGNEKTATAVNLKTGNTSSCGCYLKELNTETKTGDGLSSARGKYTAYKNAALRRGYEYSITFEQFLNLTAKPCLYCGALPNKTHRSTNCTNVFVYNGIDRFINSIGYTAENSVPCCWECNNAKGILDGPEYLALCRRISQHWNNREMEERIAV